MVDPDGMDNSIGATGGTGLAYAVGVARKALDQQRKDGEGAIALIESAAAPTRSPDAEGKGAHIDTYA